MLSTSEEQNMYPDEKLVAIKMGELDNSDLGL